MNQLEVALFQKLRAANITNPIGGGTVLIFPYQAAQNSSPPYVVFNKMSNVPVYTMGGTAAGGTAFENALYQVKAVALGPSMVSQAGSISAQIDRALNLQPLTIVGYNQMLCRRESDVTYPETADGQRWNHSGAIYRIMADPV